MKQWLKMVLKVLLWKRITKNYKVWISLYSGIQGVASSQKYIQSRYLCLKIFEIFHEVVQISLFFSVLFFFLPLMTRAGWGLGGCLPQPSITYLSKFQGSAAVQGKRCLHLSLLWHSLFFSTKKINKECCWNILIC